MELYGLVWTCMDLHRCLVCPLRNCLKTENLCAISVNMEKARDSADRQSLVLFKMCSNNSIMMHLHSAAPNSSRCGGQQQSGGLNGRMQNIIPRCS